MLGLGFEHGDGDRLRVAVQADAKEVIDPAAGAALGLALDDVDGAGGQLALDMVLRPSTAVDGRIDQLCAGVRFAKSHGRN